MTADVVAMTFMLLPVSLVQTRSDGIWFAPIVSVVLGILIGFWTERGGGVMSSLLPVRGRWSRRLLAGIAVLLLQPASPGIGAVLSLSPAGLLAPGSDVDPFVLGVWLVCSALYLTPYYRRIVEGVSPFITAPPAANPQDTLNDLLAADAASHPDSRRSFARLIVRCERRFYRALIDRGWPAPEAGRRTRLVFLDLWLDPNLSNYESIQLEDLTEQLEAENPPIGQRGLERLLIDTALGEVPGTVRETLRQWVDNPNSPPPNVRQLGLPDDFEVRRVHSGLVELLLRITFHLVIKSPVQLRECSPPPD